MAEPPGDPARVRLLLRQDERDRGAVAARAAGAPGPVDVTLVLLGRIEVDHVRDVVEIEAAGGDVGRDQRRDLAAPEPGQCPLPRVLRHVAVHRGCGDVVAAEPLDEPVGAALRPHEDERRVRVSDVVDERVELRVRRDRDEVVLDLPGLPAGRQLALDSRRAVRVLAGEVADAIVERGREEHRLPVARQPAHDPVDLRLEAHVEHPVGLVQDEDADAREVDHAPLGEIFQPAGRRDEDVRVLGPGRLLPERLAAVGCCDLQPFRPDDGLELRGHLRGELARGHEHERRRPRVGGRRVLDDRQREGQRLARAGRGPRENVEAGERVGKDQLLDAEGCVDRASGERVGNGRRHAKLAERLL